MSQTDVRTVDRETERARSPIWHIYRGYEYDPAPPGATAYCGHVKSTPPSATRPGPTGDSCVVCWDFFR